MKVRQARTENGLTLSEFASQCDLSPSYVTEIEKGRKYPRADKIIKIAETLGKEYDDMVSIKLAPSLTYLESTLSSTILQKFPFGEFGLEAGDLVNLLTREPERASALLHAILEMIRRYDVKEVDFCARRCGLIRKSTKTIFRIWKTRPWPLRPIWPGPQLWLSYVGFSECAGKHFNKGLRVSTGL